MALLLLAHRGASCPPLAITPDQVAHHHSQRGDRGRVRFRAITLHPLVDRRADHLVVERRIVHLLVRHDRLLFYDAPFRKPPLPFVGRGHLSQQPPARLALGPDGVDLTNGAPDHPLHARRRPCSHPSLHLRLYPADFFAASARSASCRRTAALTVAPSCPTHGMPLLPTRKVPFPSSRTSTSMRLAPSTYSRVAITLPMVLALSSLRRVTQRLRDGAHGGREEEVLRPLSLGKLGVRDKARVLLLLRILHRPVLPSGRALLGKPALVGLLGRVPAESTCHTVSRARLLPLGSSLPRGLRFVPERQTVGAVHLVRCARARFDDLFMIHLRAPLHDFRKP